MFIHPQRSPVFTHITRGTYLSIVAGILAITIAFGIMTAHICAFLI